MKDIKLFILLIATLGMFSCGNKRSSTKARVFSLGLSTISDFSGGAFLKIVSGAGLSSQILKVRNDGTVDVPNGEWAFQLVGFASADIHNSSAKCGKSINPEFINLDGTAIELSITVDNSTCSNAPFPTLITKINTDFGGAAGANSDFTFIWQTSVASESMTLPLVTGIAYNFQVDWGDGTTSLITSETDTDKTHMYTTPSNYTVRINGTVPTIRFDGTAEAPKLTHVLNLGDVGWTNLSYAFANCNNLTTFEGGNLSNVTSTYKMFWQSSSVVPNTSSWDVSNVTDFRYMFGHASSANPDTSSWVMSNAINIQGIFMFATSANPNVSTWNTSSVTNMASIFYGASSASPVVSSWDTRSVTTMRLAFANMSANPDLSAWDVSNVTDFEAMFQGNTIANPDTSTWVTSSATTMKNMFSGASSATSDISGFNMNNVSNTSRMLIGASSMNPDMSSWSLSVADDMSNMFDGSGLSTANYDILLQRLDTTNTLLVAGMTLGAAGINYTDSTSHTSLTSRGWTINDAGAAPP